MNVSDINTRLIEKTLSLEKYKWTMGPNGFMGTTLLALQIYSSSQKCLHLPVRDGYQIW